MLNWYGGHVAYIFAPRSWPRHIGVLVHVLLVWTISTVCAYGMFTGVVYAGRDLWSATAPATAWGAKAILVILLLGLFAAMVITAAFGAVAIIMWAAATTWRIDRVRTRILRWVVTFKRRAERRAVRRVERPVAS